MCMCMCMCMCVPPCYAAALLLHVRVHADSSSALFAEASKARKERADAEEQMKRLAEELREAKACRATHACAPAPHVNCCRCCVRL
jgi:hypothetical protein